MTGLVVGFLICCAAGLLWLENGAAAGALLPGQTQTPGHTTAAAGPDPQDSGPGIRDPALMLDLCAAMLSAGRPLSTVLLVLSEATDPELGVILRRVVTALELGAPWEQAWDLTGTPGKRPAADTAQPARVLRDALAFAAASGAPSAAVLHAQAGQIRRRRAREAERRAAALGIHLVLPLGLCALPAFLCFTVVPLLLALLPEF